MHGAPRGAGPHEVRDEDAGRGREAKDGSGGRRPRAAAAGAPVRARDAGDDSHRGSHRGEPARRHRHEHHRHADGGPAGGGAARRRRARHRAAHGHHHHLHRNRPGNGAPGQPGLRRRQPDGVPAGGRAGAVARRPPRHPHDAGDAGRLPDRRRPVAAAAGGGAGGGLPARAGPRRAPHAALHGPAAVPGGNGDHQAGHGHHLRRRGGQRGRQPGFHLRCGRHRPRDGRGGRRVEHHGGPLVHARGARRPDPLAPRPPPRRRRGGGPSGR
jgi:hypothetical protein